MRFLVIGLGSMGRRRIRCLQHLGETDIVGFDIRKDRCEESARKYGIRSFTEFGEALKENPDVFVISVPSNLHHGYALEALKRKKHFFTESNFLREGIDDLVRAEREGGVVSAPSFTMPFHPSVKRLKETLSGERIGKIMCFTYHLSAYLPEWHPWEDYRGVYYSKAGTSGAAEMVAFELTWLVWMLGDVRKVCAFKGKKSDLDTSIDDVYQIILEFEKGISGNMLIEVVSRPASRELKILGSEGTAAWSSFAGMLKIYDAKTKQWLEYPEESGIQENGYSINTHEEMYIEETGNFLEALKRQKSYPYTFASEKKVVEVLQAIEKSALTGKVVEVEHES